MELAKIYQYISMNQEVPKIFQLVKKTRNTNITPILDIEDSLEIPFDVQKTSKLKYKAREKLKELVDLTCQHDDDIKLNIRINSTDTEHLALDVELLNSLTSKIKWSAIILPKVSSVDILQEYISLLSGVVYQELIVIAETKQFFENARQILDKCEQFGISKIHFGHWDYFLSTQDFPIPLPDDNRLWKRVKGLIELLDKRGFQYIHTPFCHLLDHNHLKAMTNYLTSLSKQPVAVAALTFSQGFHLFKKKETSFSFQPKDYNYSSKEKKEIAKEIVTFFEEKQETKFSFNITGEKYRFIAPHEYLAAHNYLIGHN